MVRISLSTLIARFAVEKSFFSYQFKSVSLLHSGPNNMFKFFLLTNHLESQQLCRCHLAGNVKIFSNQFQEQNRTLVSTSVLSLFGFYDTHCSTSRYLS